VISPSQRPLPDNTKHSQQTDIHAPPVGFEPTISASERHQTHTLDRTVTGTGDVFSKESNSCLFVVTCSPTLFQVPEVQLLGPWSVSAYRNSDCTICTMFICTTFISGILLHFYIYVFSVVTILAWRLRVCLFC